MAELPLAACIMPTFNRRNFVAKAIEYFQRQDYERKQLIIVDDGTDCIRDLVPEDANLIYIRLNRKTPLGEKRNIAIESAAAEIILHWDDDDWYANDRIGYQTRALVEQGANICGLGSGLYYDVAVGKFWRCQEELHNTLFYGAVIGGSLCYTKSLWQKAGKFYPRYTLAEDSYFMRRLAGKGEQILKLSNRNTLIYIRHPGNTWRFQCGQFVKPSGWIPADEGSAAMPEEDLAFYRAFKKK